MRTCTLISCLLLFAYEKTKRYYKILLTFSMCFREPIAIIRLNGWTFLFLQSAKFCIYILCFKCLYFNIFSFNLDCTICGQYTKLLHNEFQQFCKFSFRTKKVRLYWNEFTILRFLLLVLGKKMKKRRNEHFSTFCLCESKLLHSQR